MRNAAASRRRGSDHMDPFSATATGTGASDPFCSLQSHVFGFSTDRSRVYSANAQPLLSTAIPYGFYAARFSGSDKHLAWGVALRRLGGLQGEWRAYVGRVPFRPGNSRSHGWIALWTASDRSV